MGLSFKFREVASKAGVLAIALFAGLSLGQSGAWAETHEREDQKRKQPEVRRTPPGTPGRVGVLPGPALRLGDGRFHYHEGVWYSPCGGYFCVARPAYGLMVPMLPIDRVVLPFAGMTYYFANGNYYRAVPDGYVVVQPPLGIETVMPIQTPSPLQSPPPTLAPQAASDSPLIYPQNGQSAEQVQADSTQCSNWAAAQPNGAGNVSAYIQAFGLCMDSRGYSVR
jgi:hypothetical protein